MTFAVSAGRLASWQREETTLEEVTAACQEISLAHNPAQHHNFRFLHLCVCRCLLLFRELLWGFSFLVLILLLFFPAFCMRGYFHLYFPLPISNIESPINLDMYVFVLWQIAAASHSIQWACWTAALYSRVAMRLMSGRTVKLWIHHSLVWYKTLSITP